MSKNRKRERDTGTIPKTHKQHRRIEMERAADDHTILLPALCPDAAERMFTLSSTGIKYRHLMNSTIYRYTAFRLRKIYTHHKRYPDGVINAYSLTTNPGFILYSKIPIKSNSVRIYNNKTMTMNDLAILIQNGTIIRVINEFKIEGFEMYINEKNKWPELWFGDLPEYSEDLISEHTVLPVFTPEKRVLKIGATGSCVGLPDWYTSLESAVSGQPMFTFDSIIVESELLRPFMLTAVSPYKDNANYISKTEIRNRIGSICLIVEADMSSKQFDKQVFNLVNRLGGYILRFDCFYYFKLSVMGQNIILHGKFGGNMTLKRKGLIYNGIISNNMDDLFFDILFKSHNPYPSNNLKIYNMVGRHFKIELLQPSGGSLRMPSITAQILSGIDFRMHYKRFGLIGQKGTLKSRFGDYIENALGSLVKVVDSDAYGEWVYEKWGETDRFEDRKLNNAVNILAIGLLKELKIDYVKATKPNKEVAKFIFGGIYQELLNDPALGIQQFMIDIERDFGGKHILYFIHSHLELRTMFAMNNFVSMISAIDGEYVNYERMARNGGMHGYPIFLYDFYSEHIDTVQYGIDYVDVLQMLDLDDTISW